MVYRRRRNYSRRRYPRKGNGSTDYIKMAKMAYSGVKYLKSLVNVEKHALNVTASLTPDGATGTMTLLSGIAQGDNDNQRQGNSVKLHQINVNLDFLTDPDAIGTTLRVILFRYNQSQSTSPTAVTVLTSNNFLANYNHDNVRLFSVLYDRTHTVSPDHPERFIRIFRKLGSHETFDGTSAAATDIQTGSIWLLMISDEATETPTVYVNSQLLFIDN